MISFKEYLEEMSGQEIVTKHMDSIHPDKRNAFRKHLKHARSKGHPLAASIAMARVGIGESVELDEMSKETLAAAKEKALQRIHPSFKKGDKHRAVKDTNFVAKVDKKLSEGKVEDRHAELLKAQADRKARAMKLQADMDADIAKNPVTPEESARSEKMLAGVLKNKDVYKKAFGS